MYYLLYFVVPGEHVVLVASDRNLFHLEDLYLNTNEHNLSLTFTCPLPYRDAEVVNAYFLLKD